MLKLLFLLSPVYVTLFWAITLSTNRIYLNRPKTFLGGFMFIAFVVYLSHLFFYLPLPNAYHYIDCFYQFGSILLVPFYYIYIRLLTVDEKLNIKEHLPHVILPIILFILYSTGVLLMTKDEHLYFVYQVIPNREAVTGLFLYQKIILYICRVLFPIQGVVYMALCMQLIIKKRRVISQYYSNTCEDSMTKILMLSLTLCIAIFIGIIISIFRKEEFIGRNTEFAILSISFTIIYFLVGWLGNKQRPVITDSWKDRILPECKAHENPKEMEKLRIKLENLFENDNLYLNKDLNIWDVAKYVGTNRTCIALVLNKYHNSNFSSFVNNYRVKYLKELLTSQTDDFYYNNEELAELAGFGSVMSMQRIFQHFEGISLKEYREHL